MKKVRRPTPDGCMNCCFSRKNEFVFENGNRVPGFRCMKDGRTRSPNALCKKHKRRGRIMKMVTSPQKEG